MNKILVTGIEKKNKYVRLNKDGTWDKRFKFGRKADPVKIEIKKAKKESRDYKIFGLKRSTYRLVISIVLLVSFMVMGIQILTDSTLKVTKCADIQGCYYQVNKEVK